MFFNRNTMNRMAMTVGYATLAGSLLGSVMFVANLFYGQNDLRSNMQITQTGTSLGFFAGCLAAILKEMVMPQDQVAYRPVPQR